MSQYPNYPSNAQAVAATKPAVLPIGGGLPSFGPLTGPTAWLPDDLASMITPPADLTQTRSVEGVELTLPQWHAANNIANEYKAKAGAGKLTKGEAYLIADFVRRGQMPDMNLVRRARESLWLPPTETGRAQARPAPRIDRGLNLPLGAIGQALWENAGGTISRESRALANILSRMAGDVHSGGLPADSGLPPQIDMETYRMLDALGRDEGAWVNAIPRGGNRMVSDVLRTGQVGADLADRIVTGAATGNMVGDVLGRAAEAIDRGAERNFPRAGPNGVLDIRSTGDFGNWLMDNFLENIPFMLASMGTGGLAAASRLGQMPKLGKLVTLLGYGAPTFAEIAGGSYGEMLDRGDERKPEMSVLAGLVGAGLESVPGASLMRKTGVLNDFKDQMLRNIAGDRSLRRFMMGALEQGWKEGITEAPQEALQLAAVYTAMKDKRLFSGEFVREVMPRMLDAGAAAFGIGGLTGGGATAVQVAREQRATRQAAEMIPQARPVEASAGSPTAATVPPANGGAIAPPAVTEPATEVPSLPAETEIPVEPPPAQTVQTPARATEAPPVDVGAEIQEKTPPAATEGPSLRVVPDYPTEAIATDPDRFQFKGETDIEGVGRALRKVDRWRPELAGIVSVWRDPADGKAYVVNGHHRLALAKRAGVKNMTVQFLDATDAREARSMGALINIAEGRGTPVDAAKFFRDVGITPEQVKAEGVDMTESTARDGLALGRLNDDLFRQVVQGQMSVKRGAMIGSALDTPQQKALIEAIGRIKGQVSDDMVREMIRDVKNAPTVIVEGTDLFGDTQEAANLYGERLRLGAWVRKRISSESRLFKYISDQKRAEAIEQAGAGHVDTGQAGTLANAADTVQYVYDTLAGSVGPITDALNRGAERMAQGEDRAAVRKDVYDVVRQAVEAEIQATPGLRATQSGSTETGAGGIEAGEAGQAEDRDLFGNEIPTASPVRQKQLDFAESTEGEVPIESGGQRAWLTREGKIRYEESQAELARREAERAREGQTFIDEYEGEADRAIGQARPASEPDAIPMARSVNAKARPSAYAEGRADVRPIEAPDGTTVYPIELPEMVSLIETLLGSRPKISRRMTTSWGNFVHDKLRGKINIAQRTPGYGAEHQADVMAHEAGHMLDWLPEEAVKDMPEVAPRTLARGNMLGRLLSLEKYLKHDHRLADYQNPEIKAELVSLSEWWKPYSLNDFAGNEAAMAKYRKYRRKSVELYADAMSVLFNAPNELKIRAPKFWSQWWRNLERKPNAKSEYEAIQSLYSQGPDAVAERRRAGRYAGYQRGEEAFKAGLDREQKTLGFIDEVRRAILEAERPLRVAEKRAKGPIPFDERPTTIYDEYLYRDNDVVILLDSVKNQVDVPLADAGLTREEMGDYLLFTRVARGDRQTFANPAGHTPQTATTELADMRRRLGDEKFSELTRLARQFREIVYRVSEMARDTGIIAKDTHNVTIEPNKDGYAMFAVLRYLENDPRIPATIRKQWGTYQDIANPYTSTLMKTIAMTRLANYQIAKRGILDFLIKHTPDLIKRQEPTAPGMEPKAAFGRENIWVLEDGKVRFYEAEKYICDVFNQPNLGAIAGKVNDITYGILHPLYVSYNPTWMIRNLVRDPGRTFRNLPPGPAPVMLKTAHQLLALLMGYVKTGRSAWRYAGGQIDERARTMLGDRSLGPNMVRDMNREMAVVDQLQQQVGLSVAEGQRSKRTRRGLAVLKFIERATAASEIWGKMAGYEALGSLGKTGSERAAYTRNYVATPNVRRGGIYKRQMNAFGMYSNVMLQGIKADLEVGTRPETVAGFWFKTALMDLLPKAFMALAAMGMLKKLLGEWGEDLERAYNLIGEYWKTNYVCVPLGIRQNAKTGDDEAVFVPIPHTDFGRPFAGALWKLMTRHTSTEAIEGVADAFISQLPSTSPPIDMITTWSAFAAGQNPRDKWRGHDIISRDAWKSRNLEPGAAWAEMLRWTAKQFGVASQIVRPLIGKETRATREQDPVDWLLAQPGLSGVIRSTNQGVYEADWEAIEAEDTLGAAARLHIPTAIREIVGERYRLNRLGVAALDTDRRIRRTRLNAWYSKIYTPASQRIKRAYEAGNMDDVDKAAQDMLKSARYLLED